MKPLETLFGNEENSIRQHRREHVDYIVDNGKYCPNRLRLEDLQEDINWIYTMAGLPKPIFVYISQTYLESQLAINYILNNNLLWLVIGDGYQHGYQVIDYESRDKILEFIQIKLIEDAEARIWDFMDLEEDMARISGNHLESIRHAAFDTSISDFLVKQISRMAREQVWEKAQGQTRSQIESQITKQILNQIAGQIGEKISWYDNGSFDQKLGPKRISMNDKEEKRIWRNAEKEIEKRIWRNAENQVDQRVLDLARWHVVDGNSKWDIIDQMRNGKFLLQECKIGIPWNPRLWFVSFFDRMGIVKNRDFSRYYYFLKKGIFSLQCFGKFCVVTQMPRRILTDSENRLHSVDRSAIDWRSNCIEISNYFIHGISFSNTKKDEELWNDIVSGKFGASRILKRLRNMEHKQVVLSITPIREVLKEVDANLISSCIYDRKKSKDIRRYIPSQTEIDKLHYTETRLYEVKGKAIGSPDKTVYILHYFDCSTNREYYDFIKPEYLYRHGITAENAMSFKLGLNAEEYATMEIET